MARSILIIQQQILDSITADTTIGPQLTSTSKRAIYKLISFIIATAINFLEQLIDIFTLQVETIAASASPATPSWIQNQIFKFQYSAVTPQVIQLINFAPSYSVIDTTLKIISRCSVNTTVANQVQVKVATGATPAALSTPQLNALKAYVNPPNGIGIAGVTYNITSLNSDKLYIKANIYYRGDYSAVIQANVIAAINIYLSALPFNGQMKLSDLEISIRNVSGVNDVVFINVSARADLVAFGSGTYLVQTNLVISRLWNTVSGYMVGENTAGQDFASTLNFIAE
jgi:hypothetical protein